MIWAELGVALSVDVRCAEGFEGLVLGSRGKGVEVCIWSQLFALDYLFEEHVKTVLIIFDDCAVAAKPRQYAVQVGSHAARLTAVGFVDDNGKALVLHLRADCLHDNREFVHGGDNDFLSGLKFLFKGRALVSPADDAFVVDERHYVILDLLVKINAVGDDKD